MKKIWNVYQKKKKIIFPLLGCLAVSLIGLSYVLPGQNSYVQVQDQMAGAVLNYIYQLSPFAAYVAVQWLARVTGFLGMFYLCKYLGIQQEIGFGVGILFAYMPFYPTYGFGALGQPLLVLCFLKFIRRESVWPALLGIVFYVEEMVLNPSGNLFGSYSATYAVPVLAAALFIISIGGIRKTEGGKVRSERLMKWLGGIVFLSIPAVLWNAEFVVELRNTIGGIAVYFRADRLCWILSFLWMMVLALTLEYVIYMASCYRDYPIKTVLCLGCFLLFAVESVLIFKDCTLFENIRLLFTVNQSFRTAV